MKHYTESAFMRTYPLSQKKPLVKTLKMSSLLILVGFFTGMAYFLWLEKTYNSFSMLGLIITILFGVGIAFALMYWYQTVYFKTYFYNITDKLLVIRKGVLAPREITVPFDRIQDIYLDQDVVDNMFNLYDVHISTATAESTARAHIDGVDRHTAEQLRELILQKMQEAKRH